MAQNLVTLVIDLQVDMLHSCEHEKDAIMLACQAVLNLTNLPHLHASLIKVSRMCACACARVLVVCGVYVPKEIPCMQKIPGYS